MITKISLLRSYDRIVSIELSDRLDAPPTHRLILEIAGPRSNLILVNAADDSILACAYQVSPSSSVRPLQLGQQYQPPPPPPSMTAPLIPTDLTLDDMLALTTQVGMAHPSDEGSRVDLLKRLLQRNVRGMSPNIANDIVDSIHTEAYRSQSEWEATTAQLLYSRVCAWAGVLQGVTQGVRPVISDDGSTYRVMDMASEPDMSTEPTPLLSMGVTRVVSAYYDRLGRVIALSRLREEVARKWEALHSKGAQLAAMFAEQLDEAE